MGSFTQLRSRRRLRRAAVGASLTLGEIMKDAHVALDKTAAVYGVEFPSEASYGLKANLLEAHGVDVNRALAEVG